MFLKRFLWQTLVYALFAITLTSFVVTLFYIVVLIATNIPQILAIVGLSVVTIVLVFVTYCAGWKAQGLIDLGKRKVR